MIFIFCIVIQNTTDVKLRMLIMVNKKNQKHLSLLNHVLWKSRFNQIVYSDIHQYYKYHIDGIYWVIYA